VPSKVTPVSHVVSPLPPGVTDSHIAPRWPSTTQLLPSALQSLRRSSPFSRSQYTATPSWHTPDSGMPSQPATVPEPSFGAGGCLTLGAGSSSPMSSGTWPAQPTTNTSTDKTAAGTMRARVDGFMDGLFSKADAGGLHTCEHGKLLDPLANAARNQLFEPNDPIAWKVG
jgi:hypothetical protein